MRRTAVIALLAWTCLLAVVAVVAVKQQSATPGRNGTAQPPTAVSGLHAELSDRGTSATWSTTWTLCWDPVPAAAAYQVTVVTFEGTGRPVETAETCYALPVASGSTDAPQGALTRSEQLDLMTSQMSISVRAQDAAGAVGPASPDIPVGSEYP